MGDRDDALQEHVDNWETDAAEWDYEPPERISPWLDDLWEQDVEWEEDDDTEG